MTKTETKAQRVEKAKKRHGDMTGVDDGWRLTPIHFANVHQHLNQSKWSPASNHATWHSNTYNGDILVCKVHTYLNKASIKFMEVQRCPEKASLQSGRSNHVAIHKAILDTHAFPGT